MKPQKKNYSVDRIYGKDKNIEILVAASICSSTLFFVIGFFLFLNAFAFPGNILTGMDFIVFGILGCVGPIGFYDHIKQKRKKEIADKLPEFLRDTANSTSSGMTIYDSIRTASEGEYGQLTPELKAMVSQLSWGISIKDALTNFANRVNTNELKRLAITINKALEIGGNTSSVFNAAAKEIDQIKRVEQQRKTEMSLYAIVIFISFFVFLAVILIINGTIFEAIFSLQGQMTGKHVAGMRFAQIDPDAVKNVFYLFVTVQSLGGGMLGGFMMEGRVSSGVRYGFLLVIVTFFVFKLFF